MKVSIVCVGKIKEKFFREAIEEYSKRLSRYCKLDILECADEKTPDGASEALEAQIRDTEGERILSKIPADAYVFLLAIKGKELTSPELSKKMADLAVQGKGHLVFVIGGSLGTSQAVYERADFKLSFSPMTFPHQLMRVVLLEQIYRAFKIDAGEPYHK